MRIEESNLLAILDTNRFYTVEEILDKPTLILICCIYYPDYTPFESDPHYVLRESNLVEGAGWRYFVGPEIKFFIFEEDEFHLSDVAKKFANRLLRYTQGDDSDNKSMGKLLQKVRSRLRGFGLYLMGRGNRSVLVRVYTFKAQKKSSCRIEYKATDPAYNPYLCFSVLFRAGLKGIEEGLELPPSLLKKTFVPWQRM